MQKDFSFEFKGQKHEAVIISNDPTALPTFVHIHGGGVGSKERIHTYANTLADTNIACLSFDQSGAGADAENIKKSSLQRRTEESVYAIEKFASKEPLTICGSSMGGEIAIRMLQLFPVKSLVLICPAIYDAAAFAVPFGEGFTEMIRQPESWRKSIAPKLLEEFTGKLLILIGDLDTVIPPGVIELLDASSPKVSQKEVFRIPGCGHRYQEWLGEHPDMAEVVANKVVEFSI